MLMWVSVCHWFSNHLSISGLVFFPNLASPNVLVCPPNGGPRGIGPSGSNPNIRNFNPVQSHPTHSAEVVGTRQDHATDVIKIMKADADDRKGRKGPPSGSSDGDGGDRHKITMDKDGARAPSDGIAMIGALAKHETAKTDAGDDETATGFSTTTVGLSSGVGDDTENNPDIAIDAHGDASISISSNDAPRTMPPSDANRVHGADAALAHHNRLAQQETTQDTIEEAVSASLLTLPGAFHVIPGRGTPHGTPRPSTDSPLPVDAERGLRQQQREDPTAGEDDNAPHHVPSAYLVTEEDDKSVEIAQAQQVLPFFQRKEGQLTIIIVGGLLSALAILLGVFLTRDSSASGSDVVQQELPSDVPSVAPSFDQRPTLAIVRDRGVVTCGIEDTSQEGGVNLGQFNIDSCRAISASVFGNPDKINLVIVGADDRYERLVGREVDVLLAGDSFTVEKSIREVRRRVYMYYMLLVYLIF